MGRFQPAQAFFPATLTRKLIDSFQAEAQPCSRGWFTRTARAVGAGREHLRYSSIRNEAGKHFKSLALPPVLYGQLLAIREETPVRPGLQGQKPDLSADMQTGFLVALQGPGTRPKMLLG